MRTRRNEDEMISTLRVILIEAQNKVIRGEEAHLSRICADYHFLRMPERLIPEDIKTVNVTREYAEKFYYDIYSPYIKGFVRNDKKIEETPSLFPLKGGELKAKIMTALLQGCLDLGQIDDYIEKASIVADGIMERAGL
jgi:hypothetical protein